MDAGGGGAIVDRRPGDDLCLFALPDVLRKSSKGRVTVCNDIVMEGLHASWGWVWEVCVVQKSPAF